MKKILSFLLSVLLVFPLFKDGFSQFPSYGASVTVESSSYILMEEESHKILLAKEEHQRRPMASTTKIMTALLVSKQCKATEKVKITKEAVGVEGSSVYLRLGEVFTVKELLYALLLSSANDAAVALSLHVSGNTEDFVSQMNEEAKKLGLHDTHFRNPHGLDMKDHYSSAYDLAIMAGEVLKSPLLSSIVKTKKADIGENESRRTVTNHNKLLFSMEGITGMKTGYTMTAGRCLVTSCKREDTSLIAVTLNCKNDWDAHRKLLEYGFSRMRRFVFQGLSFSCPVVGGTRDSAKVEAAPMSFLGNKGDLFHYEISVPPFLYAPCHVGEEVGTVTVFSSGKKIDTIPIFCKEEIYMARKPSFFERILEWFQGLFK